MKLDTQDPIYRLVTESVMAVETTHFERYFLRDKHRANLDWEWWHTGAQQFIGMTAQRPVVLELRWATIEGKRYMFYFPCSQLVDRELVSQWLEANGFTASNRFSAEVFDAQMNAEALRKKRAEAL